jgi:hypothetical protein
MTNNSEDTGRHALTMDTAAWLVLPANERPYRPLAVRPAAPERPAPHPMRAVDASKVHAWPTANPDTVPVPAPRPATPPVDTTPAQDLDRPWPRSKKVAVGIVTVSVAVVAIVITLLTAGPAAIGGM